MRFDALPLPEAIQQGIRAAGFAECTPIQALTLPASLAGKDVAGQAQTGTGKTAAFLIAIFARMMALPDPGRGASPRALIIAPTRELVVQIYEEAKLLGQFTGFTFLPVYGGIDYEKQRTDLAAGVDVLIGTPGRLIDYLKQKVYSLKKTQFLVIDEADRMFDMGFIADLRFLLRRMAPYSERQSMLFSATLAGRVLELAHEHMNMPEEYAVAPEKLTVDQTEQVLYHVGKEEKFPLLLGLLRRDTPERGLIFCNMKVTAERLQRDLDINGICSEAITGDVPQAKRLKILARFKDGELPILIASDVASRGLHIDGVSHVFNYDLPQDSQDYVHRIGRTGRAGASGKAISFACEDYVYSLPDIEAYIRQKVDVAPVTDDLLASDFRRAPRLSRTKRPGETGRDSRHGRRGQEHPPRERRPEGQGHATEGQAGKRRRPRRRKPAAQTVPETPA